MGTSFDTTAPPLQTALSASYVPGTNVRGEVAGANWSFLLPSMELGLAVCVGRPTSAALTMLSRLADRVAVVADARGRRETLEWTESRGVSNVFALRPEDLGSLREADLVHLTDRGRAPAIDTVVAPGGVVYREGRGPVPRRRGTPLEFHITPYGGEMRTAVPRNDHETMEYFVRCDLNCPTVDLHAMKRLLGGVGGTGNGRNHGPVSGSRAPSPKRLAKSILRRAGRAVLAGSARAEGEIAKRRPLVRWLGRRATLFRPDGEGPGPPRYLREIAKRFDVDIDGCRWGLAAHGQYSSRKVLFFLFDPAATRGSGPRWIVKLTRDPGLNHRLENLARGLETIHEIPGLDTRPVPRAAFHGHHAGLAVVAEEAVDGGPFGGRTSWTPDCAVAANAIEWLGELGASTASPTPGPAVADALRDLFDRFTNIYDLHEDERGFLSDQLSSIERAEPSIPLVFQHGDPGTWNLLADADGRVAFLDWEAAENRGMPLWDLFYFLRSFAVGCGRESGSLDRMDAIERGLFADSPMSRRVVEAVERYRERIGLPAAFVEPLFHTCWMHRALKEATRLTPQNLGSAHYLTLLRLGIARRETPTLRRLFGR